ncbi:MAG: hypothetical protein IKU51_06405 [Clostridia bacterium]|nr:hypothetical protein [Clostridia bacterium]
MKNTKRILCSLLAAVLLLSVMLSGCSMPKITLPGTGDVAATGDVELSTGEYLAYLYNEFYNMYYNQGLYQYEMYYQDYDVWAQSYTYGEGDDAEKLLFSDYIIRAAQDYVKRQIALEKLMDENKLDWLEKDVEELEADIKEMGKDAYLTLGISDENFLTVYKDISLNERGAFYGLYGKDGPREVKEEDLKKYFTDNYLSYKMISISLTNSEGKELDAEGKKKITDQLNGYLDKYNADKNFEAVMDEYNKSNAKEGEEVTATKDEDNRRDYDANDMDENLVKAIRDIEVGSAKVVEYKSGGSTPTAALIVRLDINEPAKLYTDSYEAILSSLKYEEFNEEVEKLTKEVDLTFNKKVVKKCKPENFLQ